MSNALHCVLKEKNDRAANILVNFCGRAHDSDTRTKHFSRSHLSTNTERHSSRVSTSNDGVIPVRANDSIRVFKRSGEFMASNISGRSTRPERKADTSECLFRSAAGNCVVNAMFTNS